VRAQHLPELLVPALTDEVQVHGGQVAVRLVHGDGFGIRVRDGKAVVRDMALLQGFHHGHPHAVGFMFHGNLARGGDHGDGLGQMLHGTDSDVAVVVQVRAKDGMGGVVFAVRDLAQDACIHMQRHPRMVGSC
jgi:hypothetical protein